MVERFLGFVDAKPLNLFHYIPLGITVFVVNEVIPIQLNIETFAIYYFVLLITDGLIHTTLNFD